MQNVACVSVVLICLSKVIVIINFFSNGGRYLDLGVLSVPFAEEDFLVKLTLLFLVAGAFLALAFTLSRC
jgi:hypothetical protein